MKFKEYYIHYLSLHQNKWCKRLHVLGQLVTIVSVAGIICTQQWYLLLVAPFVVYPFAWSGHYLFERNEPASFSDPAKAKMADWVMFKDWILGRIER